MAKKKHRVDITQMLSKETTPSQRVVIIRNLTQIQNALAAGYTKKKIYQSLFDAKAISCNYSFFARTVRVLLPPLPENNSTESERENKRGICADAFVEEAYELDPDDFI